ncbi:protein of unknown function [Serratia sp. Tan611]|nr:protein of unknown function [Serratia sp. Tan611]
MTALCRRPGIGSAPQCLDRRIRRKMVGDLSLKQFGAGQGVGEGIVRRVAGQIIAGAAFGQAQRNPRPATEQPRRQADGAMTVLARFQRQGIDTGKGNPFPDAPLQGGIEKLPLDAAVVYHQHFTGHQFEQRDKQRVQVRRLFHFGMGNTVDHHRLVAQHRPWFQQPMAAVPQVNALQRHGYQPDADDIVAAGVGAGGFKIHRQQRRLGDRRVGCYGASLVKCPQRRMTRLVRQLSHPLRPYRGGAFGDGLPRRRVERVLADIEHGDLSVFVRPDSGISGISGHCSGSGRHP